MHVLPFLEDSLLAYGQVLGYRMFYYICANCDDTKYNK